MIRVLLADDQQLVRTGFRVLLEASGQVEVVGEAADGAQAVTLAATLRPQVVLMDIRMPGTDGLAAAKAIISDPDLADVRIIMLTTYEEDEQVFAALRMGASGYLVKDAATEELLHTIEVVAAGEALLARP
jgi:DNA-binding NarL/FixJ family response regulator